MKFVIAWIFGTILYVGYSKGNVYLSLLNFHTTKKRNDWLNNFLTTKRNFNDSLTLFGYVTLECTFSLFIPWINWYSVRDLVIGILIVLES